MKRRAFLQFLGLSAAIRPVLGTGAPTPKVPDVVGHTFVISGEPYVVSRRVIDVTHHNDQYERFMVGPGLFLNGKRIR